MNDVNNSNPPKDQNVLSFMVQLVQERYGDDTPMEFLNNEADRLYDLFGNNLVSYFEPMLTDEQKLQFDQMVKQGGIQEQLLGFLVQAIPDLEEKIMQVLIAFRNAYLTEGRMAGQMGQMGGQQFPQTPQTPQPPQTEMPGQQPLN